MNATFTKQWAGLLIATGLLFNPVLGNSTYLDGGGSDVPDTARPASAVILDLERQFSAALLARDSAVVGNLLGEDLVHIGFEGQIVGKSEYMSFFKGGDWQYSKYSTSNLTVKALLDTAVVTGRVDRSIKVAGKETIGAFAFTHVWLRSGDRWRLSSSHVTTVPAA